MTSKLLSEYPLALCTADTALMVLGTMGTLLLAVIMMMMTIAFVVVALKMIKFIWSDWKQ